MNIRLYFAVPGDINSFTGGYGYDRRLIAELAEYGMQVEMVTLSERFPMPTGDDLADVERKLAMLPDGAILLVDGLAFGVMDEIAERHCQRLKIIALCHHPLALESGLSARQQHNYRQSEQRALQCASAIVVTSQATAAILAREFDIPPSRITVVMPGTDPQTFADCTGNPSVLLTVASLTRRKGHDVLIDALAKIAHVPWQAKFIGGKHFDVEWVSFLQRKITTYGLDRRIQLLGDINDITPEYARADLFILPSHYEGYGMVFAEALAFGLPIVATQIQAVSDLVPKTAGILVPPGNTDALAAAIARLLPDPGIQDSDFPHEYRRLQQGARQAAGNLPRWRDSAQIVKQLIDQLVIDQLSGR